MTETPKNAEKDESPSKVIDKKSKGKGYQLITEISETTISEQQKEETKAMTEETTYLLRRLNKRKFDRFKEKYPKNYELYEFIAKLMWDWLDDTEKINVKEETKQ